MHIICLSESLLLLARQDTREALGEKYLEFRYLDISLIAVDPRVSKLLMFPSFAGKTFLYKGLRGQIQELSPLGIFKAPPLSTFPKQDG